MNYPRMPAVPQEPALSQKVLVGHKKITGSHMQIKDLPEGTTCIYFDVHEGHYDEYEISLTCYKEMQLPQEEQDKVIAEYCKMKDKYDQDMIQYKKDYDAYIEAAQRKQYLEFKKKFEPELMNEKNN